MRHIVFVAALCAGSPAVAVSWTVHVRLDASHQADVQIEATSQTDARLIAQRRYGETSVTQVSRNPGQSRPSFGENGVLTQYHYEARVDLGGGHQTVARVQANSEGDARRMLESQYGKQNVRAVQRSR